MNETYVMLPAAGSLTDFFTAISILANEYQTAGNGVLICIALLILGSKFLIGDDESKARGRKQVPYTLLERQSSCLAFNIAASAGDR